MDSDRIKSGHAGGVQDSCGCDGPALREGMHFEQSVNGAEIYMEGITNPVCRVNAVGGAVLQAMNGKNDLSAIARFVGGLPGMSESGHGKLAEEIALFIAELGKAGYLKSPYYVSVVSSEVVA